ncbi:transposon Tf2-6 polyprotein [Nephila pilipes]|uniref:Transposon Tf2-6 polyprotein n=1 Tax=Nephila pilipes TaxID=299642 RepID=A0A8X6K2Q5_NEPPI|nr:transposon Tf2-6 polyprotein [Nephila pilipes]
MAEVTAVKITPYNFSDPQLWFATCERTFALGVPKPITDTCTKFNYIVSHLPLEAAAIVKGIIFTPDETDPYNAIKTQTILACITQITVEKTGDVADRILAVSTPNISLSTNAIVSSKESRFVPKIERLNKRTDNLALRHRTPQRRSISRPRNRSRNRSFSRSRESDISWYHSKFQERAKRCTSPCSYKKKRIPRGVSATTFSQPHISPRLFIKDKSSNIAFHIYTGFDVSVLPAWISNRRRVNSMQQLSAANTSPINVYEAEHIQHLRLLFERLDQYGLSINPSKCTLGVPTLKFLGFQVCSTGIKPLEDRVEAIFKFPQPTTITKLRRFLDMLNYYRRFIKQAAHIIAPLVKFLRGIRNKKKNLRNEMSKSSLKKR